MEKQCRKCKSIKPVEEFYRYAGSMDGYSHNCKACDADKRKNVELQQKYGISLDDYKQMILDQDGKCKICNYKVRRLVVDHNHVTGEVRGLLCYTCNTGLGLFDDNIDRLKVAIEYLK